MIGGILVKIAFVLCLVSSASYFLYVRRGEGAQLLRAGRVFYLLTVLTVFSVVGILLFLILNHQFQFTYVWNYSSRDLPTPLLISTLYAGQEGSFLLWTFFISIIGVFLLRNSSKSGYEPEVMGTYALIELFLLLMLMVKSPFLYVWESFPGQIAAGFAPADGRGLNPLLQNYWMVIHPQVLFSGFASMSVPYAYAVAALMKRQYTHWIKPVTPWLAFSGLVLGTGIIMGGFWAYETLGWGGYWAWDPVENSSLVPWIFAVAALHMILTQRKTGGFVRTTLVLGIFCFLMVLYSTFLTRSGVLGETSVHSFVDPGMWAYWLLVIMMAVFSGIGGVLLWIRRKEIPKPKIGHEYYSREFAIFLGAMALVAAAILITVGTSSPLITDILQGKKSAVDISYYASTITPIAIFLSLLAGVGQLLWWTRSTKTAFYKELQWPGLFAVVVTIGLVFAGVSDFLLGLLLFAAAFSLASNVLVASRIFAGNPKYAGGSIAHVGLAIMFFGFVFSSHYGGKETVSLPEGRPVQTMGYTLTYHGYRPIEHDKYAFQVSVEKDGKENRVAPIMYMSAYTNGLMRNPDIANLITHDFYIAPLSLEQPGSEGPPVERLMIRHGQKQTLGGLEITFLDFVLPDNQREAMLEGKEARIGALLSVRVGGGKAVKVTPGKIMGREGGPQDDPALVDGRYQLVITSMRPDPEHRENGLVEIGVRDMSAAAAAPAGPDVLMVEASTKPAINLVWAGVIVMLVGFGVTVFRRAQEARLNLAAEEGNAETSAALEGTTGRAQGGEAASA
jgi:cytochrome c-type biogenesis protein CcmF